MTENMVRKNVDTSGKNAGMVMVEDYTFVILALDRAAKALGLTIDDLLRAQRENEPVSIPEETIYNNERYDNLMNDFVREQVMAGVWKIIAEHALTEYVIEFYITKDTSTLIILGNTLDIPYKSFDEVVHQHYMNIITFLDETEYREWISDK